MLLAAICGLCSIQLPSHVLDSHKGQRRRKVVMSKPKQRRHQRKERRAYGNHGNELRSRGRETLTKGKAEKGPKTHKICANEGGLQARQVWQYPWIAKVPDRRWD